MVSPAPPKTAAKESSSADNGETDKVTNVAEKKKADEKAKEDAAFQALLNSQRDILARLDFGNSSSELQITEGPDNLPIVSPHASAEFQMSYDEYAYEYEQQQYEEYYQYNYPHSYDGYYQQRRQHHSRDRGLPFDSQHSVGVGDDHFILDQIEIGPGEVKGPEVFEVGSNPRRGQKRESMSEEAHRSKKRRNGSMTFQSGGDLCDDMLPGPSDLADFDESSASLLLDDLDFPSIHSHTDPTLWKPRDRIVTEDSAVFDEEETNEHMSTEDLQPSVENNDKMDASKEEKDTKAEAKHDKETTLTQSPPALATCVSMDEQQSSSSGRPPLPRRSQRSLWKPRRRSSRENSVMSVEDKRSMWKPRKRGSVTTITPAPFTMNDSAVSLHIEDLDMPKRGVPRTVSASQSQQKTLHVSVLDGDIMEDIDDDDDDGEVFVTEVFDDDRDEAVPRKRCPARTTSNDSTSSTTSVKSLSAALHQSIGSTKSIQEWDRKMGLKRSHSKTMRLSSRSREQLLAFLQKEAEQNGNDETNASEEPSKDEPEVVVVEL